mgnify:CR=1 FL=1
MVLMPLSWLNVAGKMRRRLCTAAGLTVDRLYKEDPVLETTLPTARLVVAEGTHDEAQTGSITRHALILKLFCCVSDGASSCPSPSRSLATAAHNALSIWKGTSMTGQSGQRG